MNRTLSALAAAAALMAGLAAAGPALAQDAEAEQNAEIQALKEAIQNLQIKLNGLEAQQAAQAEAQAVKGDEPKITVGPGLSISKGGNSVGLTGRLHWDVGIYPSDKFEGENFDTGTNLRRGRLGVKGKSGGFSYNLTIDVGGSADDNNEAEIDEAAIYYSPSKMIKIGFGKMKIPVTFEESTSSNDISFIERSLPVDMFTDKTLGPKAVNAQIWVYGAQSLIEAAVHARGDTEIDGIGGGAEDVGFTVRAVYAPIKTKTSALHLGGWMDRSGGPVASARWGYRTELNVADYKLLYGSSENSGLDAMVHYGLELAYLNGPFWAQTEYINGTFEKSSGPDVEADGYYVQAGYVIGGAKRYSMKKGAWSGPKVKNPFPLKGTGVIELAARYSVMDFGIDTATPSHYGKQSNVTLGLNWYLDGNTRIMFNTIRVGLNEATSGTYGEDESVTDEFWIHGVRWQYKW
ncbi:MAG: porin [Rhodospirillales bacterium]|nr:porin [Rhodospirillales bacterium]